MKSACRILLTLLLCLILCTVMLNGQARAADVVASGECGFNGNNLTWTLDSDGVLTISGTGAMKSYGHGGAPWYSFRSAITQVAIPEGVTRIGGCAFYNCDSLTSVTIPGSVTNIGDYAFRECSSLTSVTIPEGVTSIDGGAFGVCTSLQRIDVKDGNAKYCSVNGVLFNKDQTMLAVYPAGIFGDYAIPNSVMSIGDYAFWGCSGLTSVTIPEGVTSIGSYAFSGCSGLTSVTIPASVTSIGSSAFYNCSSLTSVTIPASVTSIGSSAFYNCSSLTSVTIPGSVTSIGFAAFYNCSSLTSVTIPEGVTSIGSYAFSGCSGLTSVTIPGSVTSIGDYAFYYCSSLSSVTIPASVTSIGSSAFYNCSSLTSVTIPGSVTSIGESTFSGCSGLTSVTIPESVTSIGSYAFWGCSGLTSVTLPGSVTSIGTSAFQFCYRLTDVWYRGESDQWSEITGEGKADLESKTIHYHAVEVTITFRSAESAEMYEIKGINGKTILLPDCGFTTPEHQRFRAWLIGGTEYTPGDSYVPMADTTVTAVWTDIIYSVIYTAGGGSGEMEPTSVKEGDSLVLPACGFTAPEHQRFRAWLIGDTEYAPGDSFIPTVDTMVTAVWADILYSVVYTAGGGNGEMEPTSVKEGDSLVLPACGFTAPEHQRFRAWLIGDTEYAPGDSYVPMADTMVTAVWTDILYSVIYAAGSGSGEMEPASVKEGDSLILPACGFTAPEHQYFDAWLIGDTEYAPGDSFIPTVDTTVTAVWTDILYTVTYKANGGSGVMVSDSVKDGEVLILPVCGFTAPEHQRFRAWMIGDTEYAPGDSFVPAANTTVTALWGNAYLIRYQSLLELDVSDIHSEHPYSNNLDQTWTISSPGAESITLVFDPQTAFERYYDYLSFDGYSYPGTSLAGETIEVSGDSVKLRLHTNGTTTNWGFALESASAFYGETEDSVLTGQAFYLPECMFDAPAGKAFHCWKIKGRELAPGTKYTPAADVEVTTVWDDIIYDIVFDPNGGTGTMEEEQNTYGYNLTLPECGYAFPDPEYRFKAWQIGDAEYRPGETYTLTGSITVKAIWEGLPRTIVYSWSYPVNVSGLESGHEYDPNLSESKTLSVPGAESITVVFDARTAIEEPYDQIILTDASGDRTYTGTALAGQSFTAQGSSLTITLVTDEVGSAWGYQITSASACGSRTDDVHLNDVISLPEYPFPYPEAAKFRAWLIGGTEYAPGDAFSVRDNAEATALWTDVLSVSYRANGGGGTMAGCTVSAGEPLTLPECGFTPPEHRHFKAWSINGTEYAPGDSVTVSSSIAVVAVWEDTDFIVHFDANGGAGEIADSVIQEGSCLTLPENMFTPPGGYRFAYWQIGDCDCQPGELFFPVENTIVKAVWEILAEGQSEQISIDLTSGRNNAYIQARVGDSVSLCTKSDYGLTYWKITNSAGSLVDSHSYDINARNTYSVLAEWTPTAVGTYYVTYVYSEYTVGAARLVQDSNGNWNYQYTREATGVTHTYKQTINVVNGVKSGACGEYLSWILDSNGKVTITGEGSMYDYSDGNSPFTQNKSQIRSVVIEDGAVSIGKKAFYNCQYLTAATIPNSVQDIRYGAFNCCFRLSSLSLPTGLTDIGDWAFAGIAVPNVVIPGSVDTIGAFAFYDCDSLVSVEIGEGVSCIKDNTFSNSENLVSVVIPGSMKSIGWDAFSGCDSLAEVHYKSIAENWNKIEIMTGNEPLVNAIRFYDLPLTITSIKADKTNANTGEKITWTAKASGGAEPLQYYFILYKDGTQIKTRSYSTTKTFSYSPTEAGTYKVKVYVKDSVGTKVNKTSSNTTVILGVPVITAQPANQSVTAGAAATFSIAASGTGLSYQWQYSKDGSTWTNKSGATAASYTVTAKTSYDGMRYRCKVTNEGGSVYSDPATLTVTAAKPVITAQPGNQSVTAGKTAIFKVAASGTGLSYQWQYSKDGSTWTNKSGATAASYTVTAKASYNGMRYRCKVTNEGGSVYSDPATLTVTAAKPVITTQPANQSVTTGATATFKVAASGTRLSYQWQYSKDGSTWTNKSGATAASYTVAAKTSYNGMRYRCKVTNEGGSVYSDPATLTVTAAAPVISSIKADKTDAFAGEKLTWTATATGGTGALQYYFILYKDGVKVKTRSYSTANTFSYTPLEAGTYKARVYVKDAGDNKVNKLSAGVSVVLGPTTLVSVKAGKTGANAGEKLTWTATAVGREQPLQYYFILYKDGVKVKTRSYSTTDTFSYTPTEAGTYRVRVYVKDASGTKVNKLSAAVTVS